MGDMVDVNEAMAGLDLEAIAAQIRALARSREGDNLALLELLRQLESVHREVQDTYFQDALPTNRQALYSLLRDIEVNGGWPYINRMRLRDLLQKLATDGEPDPIAGDGAPAPRSPQGSDPFPPYR